MHKLDGIKTYWLVRNKTTGVIHGRDSGHDPRNLTSINKCFHRRGNAIDSVRYYSHGSYELIPVTIEVKVHTDKPEKL
jgi:hypothetical protein